MSWIHSPTGADGVGVEFDAGDSATAKAPVQAFATAGALQGPAASALGSGRGAGCVRGRRWVRSATAAGGGAAGGDDGRARRR